MPSRSRNLDCRGRCTPNNPANCYAAVYRKPGSDLCWVCTLPKGHKGPHVACTTSQFGRRA